MGGAYLLKRLTANFSGASYSVGAKGSGGAAGNNAGTNGGNTTFTDTAGSPTTYTATGGLGGSAGTALAVAPISRVAMTGSVPATNGDVNQDGWIGAWAITLATGSGTGCFGGNSRFGQGGFQNGLSGANTSVAGGAATGKGAGGGAAIANGSGADAAGGNGSDGVIIIYEYS